LFEFGDADEVGVVGTFGLKDGVEAVEDGGLPGGQQVGLEVVFAAEFGLAGLAAQELQNDLGLELSREGSTGTRHDRHSRPGPVKVRLLVQRQGRTSYTYGELLLEEGIGFERPLAVYPRQTNSRVHAQRAWFTMHGDEFVRLETVAREHILQRIDLPRAAIPAARRFLEHAGIDHYLLFADLENLSRHLREKSGYK
jgi:hypothetical protein